MQLLKGVFEARKDIQSQRNLLSMMECSWHVWLTRKDRVQASATHPNIKVRGQRPGHLGSSLHSVLER